MLVIQTTGLPFPKDTPLEWLDSDFCKNVSIAPYNQPLFIQRDGEIFCCDFQLKEIGK